MSIKSYHIDEDGYLIESEIEFMSRMRKRRALIMLVGRYALLALIAYVMISRLRLSPLGLLLGVSVIPLAATIEVLAALKTSARGNQ